ncbi:MAG: molybdenum cofactor biosynthesis protein MoaE, partial [Thermodesulfobacteriota bacterium]
YVTTINYTAYETMAENEINKIVDNAIKRFGLIYVVVKHRLGKVKLNETAFFVAVFSQHRKEGIKSMDFIIDEVKNKVPIWKEEFYSDGSKSFKSGLLIK